MSPVMHWTDKIYAKSVDFVQREVAGEFILVPIRQQLSDVNSLYVLNETSTVIWRRIDGTRSIRAILTELSQEYDVTGEQLEKDLATLIDDLLSIRAIQEASR
jgi:coenzyme PQQ synthesis protein D (PqqD)